MPQDIGTRCRHGTESGSDRLVPLSVLCLLAVVECPSRVVGLDPMLFKYTCVPTGGMSREAAEFLAGGKRGRVAASVTPGQAPPHAAGHECGRTASTTDREAGAPACAGGSLGRALPGAALAANAAALAPG